MIRSSYSNKDIKDVEEEVGLMAQRAHGLGARQEPSLYPR
jgi:hypothetical protein